MRGAHAARAVLLMVSCCLAQGGAAGQDATGARPAKGAVVSPPPVRRLAEGGSTRMPGGFAALCRRDPSFCRPAPVLASLGEAGQPPMQLLTRINERVNHSISATTDRALYGVDEYWTIPRGAGDCEDFVLLKRRMLMEQGLPEASLLITVVHDENGEGHAVLTVPEPAGDLVLDNRRDEILRWWETGYSFVKRQSEYDPLTWVALGDDRLQATEIASGPGLP